MWPQSVRISLDQLLEASSELSLRQVVNHHVLKLLKKNQSVLIDDCNYKRGRRGSCVNLISQKLPHIKIKCCVTSPTFGLEQLLWRREIDIAQMAHFKEDVDMDWMKIDQMIRNWDEWADQPSADEGFILEQHNTHITMQTAFKVELAGLFIQFEAVFTSKDGDLDLVSGVHEAISTWYRANPCGRCVLIQDGATTAGVTAMEKESNTKYILKEVASKLEECVVFLVSISSDSVAGSYCVPPNPGVLAFSSRLHLIDLNNQATMYWYQNPSHMKMAERAGVKHIKASRVFTHTRLAASSHATVRPTVPEMLRTLQVTRPLPTTEALYRQEPFVPLYDLCTDGPGVGLVCKKVKCGRTLYLAYREWSVIQRYQKLYIECVSDVDSEGVGKIAQMSRHSEVSLQTKDISQKSSASLSGSLRDRDLPEWMLSKKEKQKLHKKKEDTAESKNKHAGMRPPLKSVGSSTVYVLSEEELLDTAKTHLLQAGESVPSEMEVQLYLSQRPSREQEHLSKQTAGSPKTAQTSHRRAVEKNKNPVTPAKRSRLAGGLVESMVDVEDILEHTGEDVTQSQTHRTHLPRQRSQIDMDLDELMVTSLAEVASKETPEKSTNLDLDDLMLSPRSEGNSKGMPQKPGDYRNQSHVTGSRSAALKPEKIADTSDEQFDAFLSSLIGDTQIYESKSDSHAKNTSNPDIRATTVKKGPRCVSDSFEKESELGSKKSSSASSHFTVPDSYVTDSSRSKSISSSKSSKDSTVPDSFIPSSGEPIHQSSKRSVQTVPDSFVASSGSVKQSVKSRKSSDEVVPNSFVGESASSNSTGSVPRQTGHTVADSLVGNTPSLKSSSSTKSSIRTVPDSLIKDSSSFKSRISDGSGTSKEAFVVAESYVADSSTSSSVDKRSIRSEVILDSFVKETPSTGDSIGMVSSSDSRVIGRNAVTWVTDTTTSGSTGDKSLGRGRTMDTDLSFLDDLI